MNLGKGNSIVERSTKETSALVDLKSRSYPSPQGELCNSDVGVGRGRRSSTEGEAIVVLRRNSIQERRNLRKGFTDTSLNLSISLVDEPSGKIPLCESRSAPPSGKKCESPRKVGFKSVAKAFIFGSHLLPKEGRKVSPTHKSQRLSLHFPSKSSSPESQSPTSPSGRGMVRGISIKSHHSPVLSFHSSPSTPGFTHNRNLNSTIRSSAPVLYTDTPPLSYTPPSSPCYMYQKNASSSPSKRIRSKISPLAAFGNGSTSLSKSYSSSSLLQFKQEKPR